jgi:hypothetical protein
MDNHSLPTTSRPEGRNSKNGINYFNLYLVINMQRYEIEALNTQSGKQTLQASKLVT